MTITEFLEARIAEDEAALERTGWFPHSTHGSDAIGTYRADCPDCLGVPSRERVLAECAAKREIIAMFKPEDIPREWDPEAYVAAAIEGCLLALAGVYADHPDYQAEWGVGESGGK